MELVNGGLGDQGQVNLTDQILKQDVDDGFHTKGQAQCIKFEFVIAAIHRGNIDGEMPFFIDVFPNFKRVSGKNEIFQRFQKIKKPSGFFSDMGFGQRILQLIEFWKRIDFQLIDIMMNFRDVRVVFVMQQLIEFCQQTDPFNIDSIGLQNLLTQA